jgi:hypothetical protein
MSISLLDTPLVRRGGRNFTLSLGDAKEKAERARTQGSVFQIETTPVLFLHGKSKDHVIGQCFAEKPLIGALEYVSKSLEGKAPLSSEIVYKISKFALKQSFGFVGFIESNVRRELESNNSYLCFESSSQGSQYYLGWRRTREIDSIHIREILRYFKKARNARHIS